MRGLFCWFGFILVCAFQSSTLAGGSGLNVVVVVNRSSSNSGELGNYFCEQRHIPPQNLLRINWTNGVTTWTRAEFENTLAAPIQAMLAARSLTNQIEFVVLSMDIPHTITQSNGQNSTTSALFYGFKPDDPSPGPGLPDSCSLPAASSNLFAGSEYLFRNIFPDSTNFLTTMITASNLALAKQIVDQGVKSDGMFPTQTVILAKSSDPDRNVRYLLFDDAILNTRLRGNYSMVRTDSDSLLGLTNLLGYQNGLYQFTISSNTFVPGAMADNLTSYGGVLFEPNDHTTLLSFLEAGAAGSYGTVVEPCNYLEKFPSPQNYFYQARGFNLAECYYQSLTNPYQGLIVGEPLAAPFAQPAIGTWNNLPDVSTLTGSTNLSLRFNSGGTQHPVQQVDLFLDGTFLRTLTNLPPRQFNKLFVTINGRSINYTVSVVDTIQSITSNLTAVLNTASFTNATKVHAFTHGDRIELHLTDPNANGSQSSLSVSNSQGIANDLRTFISASRTNFLDDANSNLPPRNHLYITAGATNIPLTFSLDTTTLADGFHELTAVAYEGSHVRTQTRISQNVRVQNNLLSATFAPLFGETNFAAEGTLQFSVVANTNNISKIELFSTGGLLVSATNQNSAIFNVAGANLGIGLHPFYALVTDTDGKVYRTETKFIRLVGVESAFVVYASRFPVALSWPAIAGRNYDVLSTTNLVNAFQPRATVTATNSVAQWIEAQQDSSERFYRVRVNIE